jgi:hypothetical protein
MTVQFVQLKKIVTLPPNMVDVAQLVRATDCGSVGRGFEPHLPPLTPLKALVIKAFSILGPSKILSKLSKLSKN